MSESPPILQTVDVQHAFGAVVAADNLNVQIKTGEMIGIVGANGSGKTTFLNLITGYIRPNSGRVLFMGKDTTGMPPRDITKLGVARSFQIPQLYSNMTVIEGMLLSLAATAGQASSFWKPMHRDSWISEGRAILESFGR